MLCKVEEVTFASRDNLTLHGKLFFDRKQPLKAAAVLAPGIGIQFQRYTRMLEYLQACGIAVLGFDYRGIGVNAYTSVRQLKHLNPGADEWCAQDLSAAIDFMRNRMSVDQVVGIGHSFGGTAFGLIDNPEAISGLVFVSTSSGYLGYYGGLVRIKKALYLGLVIPLAVKLKGYMPARLYRGCHPLPGKFILQWTSWCFWPDYMKAGGTEIRFSRLKVPIRALGFHDDPITTEAAMRALVDLFDGCNVNTTFFRHRKYGHNAILYSRYKKDVWAFMAESVLQTCC
jgi:predicted alpha/beta hydrolase